MDNEKLSPEGQQAAFAEVVRQRYNSFMPKFINYLCRQYSFLSHSEAMDNTMTYLLPSTTTFKKAA